MKIKKKVWKKKEVVRLCGICEECNKELLSNEGGWIITHTKEKQYANGRKKEVQLYKGWQEKSKSIRKEKRYENEIER